LVSVECNESICFVINSTVTLISCIVISMVSEEDNTLLMLREGNARLLARMEELKPSKRMKKRGRSTSTSISPTKSYDVHSDPSASGAAARTFIHPVSTPLPSIPSPTRSYRKSGMKPSSTRSTSTGHTTYATASPMMEFDDGYIDVEETSEYLGLTVNDLASAQCEYDSETDIDTFSKGEDIEDDYRLLRFVILLIILFY